MGHPRSLCQTHFKVEEICFAEKRTIKVKLEVTLLVLPNKIALFQCCNVTTDSSKLVTRPDKPNQSALFQRREVRLLQNL